MEKEARREGAKAFVCDAPEGKGMWQHPSSFPRANVGGETYAQPFPLYGCVATCVATAAGCSPIYGSRPLELEVYRLSTHLPSVNPEFCARQRPLSRRLPFCTLAPIYRRSHTGPERGHRRWRHFPRTLHSCSAQWLVAKGCIKVCRL